MALRRWGGPVLGLALAGLLAAPGMATAQQSTERSETGALRLGLSEAMRMAFEHNLDIRVVGYDRSVAQEQVRSARGRFEPLFYVGLPGVSSVNPFPAGGAFGSGSGFGGFGFSDTRSPSSTALAGATTVTSRSVAWLLDWQQTLQSGTRYDVSYNVGRSNTNSIFQSLNPSWDNTLALSIVQPLLNGRGRESTAVELRLAQAGTRVSEQAFRAQVEQVMLQVEGAYWEAVFAARDLEVKKQSLQLAREQLERTGAQVEVGLIAPVEATQAEVQVAARETELIVARNSVEDAYDSLRALLRADSLPGGWDTALELADEPSVEATDIDMEAAIATALESRAEIHQGQASVAVRQVQVAADRNALQPRLDVVGQISANGIGGDLLVRDGFPGQIVDVLPGGYGDALSQLFGFDFVSWRLGVNVTVPIGNSTAEGRYAQATIEEDRARAELERTRQQIILEVRSAARGVTAAAEAAVSASKTRELAERQLQIETDRFDVGMSTNFEVLQFQDDLAVARSGELRAKIDYRLAQAQLQRATGGLMQRYGIEIRGREAADSPAAGGL